MFMAFSLLLSGVDGQWAAVCIKLLGIRQGTSGVLDCARCGVEDCPARATYERCMGLHT